MTKMAKNSRYRMMLIRENISGAGKAASHQHSKEKSMANSDRAAIVYTGEAAK